MKGWGYERSTEVDNSRSVHHSAGSDRHGNAEHEGLSEMKRILHIGAPTCASTFLQRDVFPQWGPLYRSWGALPTDGGFIYSDESLWSKPDAALTLAKNLGIDVVIMGWREPDELARSWYLRQVVSRMMRVGFTDWYSHEEAMGFFDNWRRLKMFEDAGLRVFVFHLADLKAVQDEVLGCMAGACGVEFKPSEIGHSRRNALQDRVIQLFILRMCAHITWKAWHQIRLAVGLLRFGPKVMTNSD